jgi:hypothetical protein
MASGHPEAAELERIRLLARDLAGSHPGAAELGYALADAADRIAGRLESITGQIEGITGRVDGLWRLITAVLESAGLAEAAEAAGPAASPPSAEFLQAVSAPRGSSDRALRLNINNKEWVAAISQDQPPADPARTWAALERLTRTIEDQGDA